MESKDGVQLFPFVYDPLTRDMRLRAFRNGYSQTLESDDLQMSHSPFNVSDTERRAVPLPRIVFVVEWRCLWHLGDQVDQATWLVAKRA